MEALENFLPYIQIIFSVLLVTLILLQSSDASLGGAFGGGDSPSSTFHTKRGIEKVIFKTTIVVAVLFALSSFANLWI